MTAMRRNSKSLRAIVKIFAIGTTVLVVSISSDPIVCSIYNALVWGCIEIHTELLRKF
jgi:hypothetical protein